MAEANSEKSSTQESSAGWLNRTVLGVGVPFGTLAAMNAVGDFLSSPVVGFLWSAVSARAAFSFSAVLFFLGAFLILRLRK